MIPNKFKSGFTLVELMVFFLFISILIAASTPLITKRIKTVPLRANHGKFVCYRDAGSGRLIAKYYNGWGREISSESTDSDTITFTPPKRAAIFKVEMTGAGAGGYDYVLLEDEEDPIHISTFNENGDGEFSADNEDGYRLQDSDIKSILNGQQNTIAVYTGHGGKGGDLDYQYFDPTLAYCVRGTYKDSSNLYHYYQDGLASIFDGPGEGNINTYGVISDNEAKFQAAIRADASLNPKTEGGRTYRRTYIADHTSTLDTYCSSNNLDGLYQVERVPMQTLSGGRAGKGQYLSYTYTIDFSKANPGESAANYLKRLQNSYGTGSSSAAAGTSGFHFNAGSGPSNGTDGSNRTFSNTSTYSSKPAASISNSSENGTDATGYAVIKTPNGYISNKQKATGGTGVVMWIEELTGLLRYEVKDGQDADGFYSSGSAGGGSGSGSGGSGGAVYSNTNNTTTQYVKMVSSVPVRTYWLGAAGESGKYVSHQLPYLGTSCTITIPPRDQSTVITESMDLDDITIQNTTFTCEGWSSHLSAASGVPSNTRYQIDPVTGSKPVYNPYVENNGYIPATSTNAGRIIWIPQKLIAPDSVLSSFFGTLGNVLTRGVDLSSYGKGGDGTGYTDKCTKLGGLVNLYQVSAGATTSENLVRSISYEGEKDPPSCISTNNIKTPPTAGGMGAVVVSW